VIWSLIDFNLRPKHTYYAVKRAIAPLVVGAARVEVETSRDNEFTGVHIHKEKRLQVWASSFGVDEVHAELLIQGIDVTKWGY
jgi:beta-mannosidase